MTSRTDDYNCPRCGRYLFSAYTGSKDKKEREALEKKAATQCNCKEPKK